MKKMIFIVMLQSVLAGCSLGTAHKVNDPYDYKELVTREVKPVKVSKKQTVKIEIPTNGGVVIVE